MATEARVNIVASLPLDLKNQVDQIAKDRGISTAKLVRIAVSNEVGFELPIGGGTRPHKYATVEEREAAVKARALVLRNQQKDLRSLMKDAEAKAALEALMASFKAKVKLVVETEVT